MNEIFLIGKIFTDIDFKFIVNLKKKKSIVMFRLETIDANVINIVAYNKMADYIYSKIKKEDIVFIYGEFKHKNNINVRKIIKLQKCYKFQKFIKT